MRIPIRSAGRRLTALLGASALAAIGLVAVATPAQAAVSCQVTYTKAWDNGSGFGANITITNTGD
ncbi:cellulose 1,4-beta-cellobiosidase, partial [Catellatospora aurea]